MKLYPSISKVPFFVIAAVGLSALLPSVASACHCAEATGIFGNKYLIPVYEDGTPVRKGGMRNGAEIWFSLRRGQSTQDPAVLAQCKRHADRLVECLGETTEAMLKKERESTRDAITEDGAKTRAEVQAAKEAILAEVKKVGEEFQVAYKAILVSIDTNHQIIVKKLSKKHKEILARLSKIRALAAINNARSTRELAHHLDRM